MTELLLFGPNSAPHAGQSSPILLLQISAVLGEGVHVTLGSPGLTHGTHPKVTSGISKTSILHGSWPEAYCRGPIPQIKTNSPSCTLLIPSLQLSTLSALSKEEKIKEEIRLTQTWPVVCRAPLARTVVVLPHTLTGQYRTVTCNHLL